MPSWGNYLHPIVNPFLPPSRLGWYLGGGNCGVYLLIVTMTNTYHYISLCTPGIREKLLKIKDTVSSLRAIVFLTLSTVEVVLFSFFSPEKSSIGRTGVVMGIEQKGMKWSHSIIK